MREFEFDIKYGFKSNSSAELKTDTKTMQEEILRKYRVIRPYLSTAFEILSTAMAWFFTTIFLKAYLYITKFIRDVSFDNHYLTKGLVDRLSAQNKVLRTSQVRKLVRVTQWKRTAEENKRIIMSLATSAIYTTAAVAIVFFDLFLYYTLEVIKDYGKVEVNYTGGSEIELEVTGDGFMRDIIEYFVGSYHSANNLDLLVDNEKCLPNPARPDNFYIIYCAVLLLFVLYYVTVFTQTWVLRLRHIICCMFFEGTESARLTWLTNQITHEIENKNYIMSKSILRSLKENYRESIYSEVNLGRKMAPLVLKFRGYCFVCRQTTWGRHVTRNCENHFQNGVKSTVSIVYCSVCYKELCQSCVLCIQKLWDIDAPECDKLPDDKEIHKNQMSKPQ